MKLWRLIPVVAFVGVLAAATVGLAAVQNIDSDHNFAAEGEQAAKSCDEIEVEYGQTNGHVDRVKLHYPAGNDHVSNCGGEFVKIEIHDASHGIMGECNVFQFPTTGPVTCDLRTAIPNEPCTHPFCVHDIAHINLVVTDLN